LRAGEILRCRGIRAGSTQQKAKEKPRMDATMCKTNGVSGRKEKEE
jgi:hypothetical protein